MRTLLTVLLLSLPSVAAAHNAWIKPSAASISGADGWVTFDAATSTDPFVADHQPMRLEAIHAIAPDGSDAKLENALSARYRTTFDLHLTQQGTYRVMTVNAGIVGSYLLNGELHRVGGRGGPPPGARPVGGGGSNPGAPGDRREGPMAAAGAAGGAQRPPLRFESGGADFALPPAATDVKLGERTSRTEVFVTLGRPSAIAPTGKGLELQPITHPDDLVADQPARFVLLVDGRPAPGIAVKLIADGRRYRDAVGEIALKSDAKGEVTIAWPAPGLYWFSAAATDGKVANPVATERRLNYVTTLEVAAS